MRKANYRKPKNLDYGRIQSLLEAEGDANVRVKVAKVLLFDTEVPSPQWLREIAADYNPEAAEADSERVRLLLESCGYHPRFAAKRSVYNPSYSIKRQRGPVCVPQ